MVNDIKQKILKLKRKECDDTCSCLSVGGYP